VAFSLRKSHHRDSQKSLHVFLKCSKEATANEAWAIYKVTSSAAFHYNAKVFFQVFPFHYEAGKRETLPL
jgi:hypothetical protein